MSDEQDPDIAALVAGMMQPPVLVPVGRRFDFDDAILLFSHVEIWPWRLMLRAAHASRGVPPPMKLPLTSDGELDKEAAKAMVSERRGLGHPLTASWMNGWAAVDDVGTDYRVVGGGSGGPGGDWWRDFHVHLEPAPPTAAHSVSLMGPRDATLTVALPTDAA